VLSVKLLIRFHQVHRVGVAEIVMNSIELGDWDFQMLYVVSFFDRVIVIVV